MRETDRLDRQCDVTILWGADEELAVVSVTASGKPDCPGTGNAALGRVSPFGRNKCMGHRDNFTEFVLINRFEGTD